MVRIKKAVREDGLMLVRGGYFFAAAILVWMTAFLRLLYALRRFLCSTLLYCLPICFFTLFADCDLVCAL